MLETIVALATPPIKSALAIVRLSGSNCFQIVSRFFSRNLKNVNENKIIHGYIKDNDEIVDEVVLLAYKGPKSFTGEDSVEIISHGSLLITNKIIELSIKFGARMAKNGEFTSRSFMNNKLDLIQAESINDLINSDSVESQKISLMALEGKTSKLLEPLKKSLGDLLSLIETNINYPEYTDIEEANYIKINKVCLDNINYINKLINDGEKGLIIKNGVNIAIIGKPNVGKSSLLNAILGEEKAIVTDIKGTTRDVVEGQYNLDGVILNFFDTAGIRKTKNIIESKGIEKSKDVIKKADIIVVLLDNNKLDIKDFIKELENKKVIYVINKADQISDKNQNYIYISALNNDIQPLMKEIKNILNLDSSNFSNPSIANTRQLGILKNVVEILNKVVMDCKKNTPIDLLSVNIQGAYLQVLSILGEDHDFDIANEIFSRFCLGK